MAKKCSKLGRPPRYSKTMERLTVSIPREIKAWIVRRATNGRSQSDVVTKALSKASNIKPK